MENLDELWAEIERLTAGKMDVRLWRRGKSRYADLTLIDGAPMLSGRGKSWPEAFTELVRKARAK